jgi:hypothetical protein
MRLIGSCSLVVMHSSSPQTPDSHVQIDRNGRVINLERARGKLHIIEQEFKQAEHSQQWREKEEAGVRQRVQAARHAALDRARREAQIARLKEDRRMRGDIVRASNEAQGLQAAATAAAAARRCTTAAGGARTRGGGSVTSSSRSRAVTATGGSSSLPERGFSATASSQDEESSFAIAKHTETAAHNGRSR